MSVQHTETRTNNQNDHEPDHGRRDLLKMIAALPLSYGVFASALNSSPAFAESKRKPVALITGSSSGFGKLSAITLARNGFHVFASMRDNSTKNAKAAEALRNLAGKEALKIDIIDIDIDSDKSVNDGVADILSRVDRIDVLFNNAGINIPGPVELSMEAARQNFETNVFGQLRMLRAVAPGMREHRHGLIIQMSSGLGRLVMPTSGIYCATKFAQEALFESAAYELHPFGVEVAIIQPSDYATKIKENSRRYYKEMMESLNAEDQKRAKAYKKHLSITEASLQEPPTPPVQEVADAVLKLATTPAGKRPLRHVAMPPEYAEGMNQLNGTLEGIQGEILRGSGMGDWLELTK